MVRVRGRLRRSSGMRLAWLVIGLSGCALAPPPPAPVPSGRNALFVIDRGWHTDIGVPVPQPNGALSVFETEFPGVRYLVFGFGERAFFTAPNRTIGAALRALLPSPAAILVTALRSSPPEAFGPGHVVVLHLQRGAVEQIVQFIWNDFARNPADRPRLLADGPYPGSLFYFSVGTYDALYTCNTWTAEALRAGGVPVRAFGTVFSSQVMDQVRELSSVSEARSPSPSNPNHRN